MADLILFCQLAVEIGTPLLFATLGGILIEKSGNLNLGTEGMMMIGALAGFRTAYYTGNPALAILSAGIGSMLLALIYAALTVTFRTDQTVTGFAITIFGTGVSNFLGKSLQSFLLEGTFSAQVNASLVPFLRKMPVIGTIFFDQSFFVPTAILLAVLLYFYYKYSRPGLCIRMVGENPASADASGINVTLYKYVHIVAGGFLCGMGGAFLSIVYVPRWQDNITAGLGWIAVALVIFSTWNPLKAIGGAYLFGVLKALAIKFQNVTLTFGGLDVSLSSQIMDMIPYIMTIIVLVITTLSRKRENQAPESLGRPYYREER